MHKPHQRSVYRDRDLSSGSNIQSADDASREAAAGTHWVCGNHSLAGVAMFLIWCGVALIIAKLAEVGPLAELGWLWVAAPFGLAFIWFEFIEAPLGFDKRKRLKESNEAEAKRERVAKNFLQPQNRR